MKTLRQNILHPTWNAMKTVRQNILHPTWKCNEDDKAGINASKAIRPKVYPNLGDAVTSKTFCQLVIRYRS
jgi:hypothetical protein